MRKIILAGAVIVAVCSGCACPSTSSQADAGPSATADLLRSVTRTTATASGETVSNRSSTLLEPGARTCPANHVACGAWCCPATTSCHLDDAGSFLGCRLPYQQQTCEPGAQSCTAAAPACAADFCPLQTEVGTNTFIYLHAPGRYVEDGKFGRAVTPNVGQTCSGPQLIRGNSNQLPASLVQATIEVWVRTRFRGEQAVLGWGTAPLRMRTLELPAIASTATSSQLRLRLGSTTCQGTSARLIQDGAWHFLVATYVNGNSELFVDGTSIATCSMGDTDTHGFGGFFIGDAPRTDGGSCLTFQGDIDELRLISQDRTAADVAQDMQGPMTVSAGAYALWHFDEGPTVTHCCPSGSACGSMGGCLAPKIQARCPAATPDECPTGGCCRTGMTCNAYSCYGAPSSSYCGGSATACGPGGECCPYPMSCASSTTCVENWIEPTACAQQGYPTKCGEDCCADAGSCSNGRCVLPQERSACPAGTTACTDGGVCCPSGTACSGASTATTCEGTSTLISGPDGPLCGGGACTSNQRCAADAGCCTTDDAVCGGRCCPNGCSDAGDCACAPEKVPCGEGCCGAGLQCVNDQCVAVCATGTSCGLECCAEQPTCSRGTGTGVVPSGHCACPADHPVQCGASCCLAGAACEGNGCGCPDGRALCGALCCGTGKVCEGGQCVEPQPEPGGGGGGGGGGNCPPCTGGWVGSTRACTPLGGGGGASCDCRGQTSVCVKKAEYESALGRTFPSCCLPRGATGCFDADKLQLIAPCCAGLSCKVASVCGGGSAPGGICD